LEKKNTVAVPPEVEHFHKTLQVITDNIRKVIVGHEKMIDEALTCLLCDGHGLIEGVPGLGKTLMVRTLAQSIGAKFSRIQFTPDLMPSDIVGTDVVIETEDGGKKFDFRQGPVFGNIILADEINRATPKTQSALLQAMQEKSVTVGGRTYELAAPFFVLATQNPLEMEGTFPLPEAQLDRFFFKILLMSSNLKELVEIVDRTCSDSVISVSAVAQTEDILAMRRTVRRVPVASHVKEFAARIVLATHPESDSAAPLVKRYVRYGASPRGVQCIVLAAKARALKEGRFNVAFEDCREVARPALRHRIILNFEGEAEGIDRDAIISQILDSIPTTSAK
jgi:MoxR-like ATPase